MTIHELLKKYWGYDKFRPLQEDIINSVLNGNDTLALLPTGGGKSICFQVPAMALDGLCIVISPLIALMKDQVQHLKEKGINAEALVSGIGARDTERIINNCLYGNMKFLYVSPERLKNRSFLDAFKQMKIGLIAVDEAHCISQWGYDFRPPYLEIAQIRAFHPKTVMMALTATATPAVVADIQDKLAFGKRRNVFQKSFYRENLTYMAFYEEDKYGRMLRIIAAVKGSGIVYVRNRRRTQEIAEFLTSKGIRASYYHAGLKTEDRDIRQKRWMSGETPVIVATNAFGMGIDKPDVRYVIHLDLPDSPEAYFQEAGRGGRDEKQAYAVILYNNTDIDQLRQNFATTYPPLQYIRNAYRAVCNYYQMPEGSGLNQKFNFDPMAICDSYGFQVVPFFSALRFLEKEGLLLIPERQETTSRVKIIVSNENLYHFQVGNPAYDDLIKLMLRMYGGLFTNHVSISERAIARKMFRDEDNIVSLLRKLHKMNYIDYQEKETCPQIIFSSPRVSSQSLFISDANYKTLKENALVRINAMIDYVRGNEFCRSSALLYYFGEKNNIRCGRCDVCIAKKRKDDTEKLQQKILEILNNNPMLIKTLCAKMPSLDEKAITDTVHEMIDYNILGCDEDMRLYIK
ncbi:MAG: RecQ family ATP-dependent DNA helicase [Bacteroidales bacterium]|nr:RecQ family ATP-dependent DNA helicase [Bacteroidales bacterium]